MHKNTLSQKEPACTNPLNTWTCFRVICLHIHTSACLTVGLCRAHPRLFCPSCSSVEVSSAQVFIWHHVHGCFTPDQQVAFDTARGPQQTVDTLLLLFSVGLGTGCQSTNQFQLTGINYKLVVDISSLPVFPPGKCVILQRLCGATADTSTHVRSTYVQKQRSIHIDMPCTPLVLSSIL